MRKLAEWLLAGGLLPEFLHVLTNEGQLPVARELFVPVVFAFGAATACAVLGRALARNSARWRTIVLGSGALSLTVAVAMFSTSVQHNDYPHHADMFVRLIYAVPCLAAAALGKHVRSSLRITLGLALVGFAVADPVIAAVHGLYMHSRGGRARDGVVIQSSPVTCAPAAMANLLAAWGLDIGEGQLAFALRTTVFRGTSLAAVPANIRHLGLDTLTASYVEHASFAELERRDLPVLLGVFYKGYRAHAVALLGMRDGMVAVADPALGLLCAPIAEYRRFSGWQGEVVAVDANTTTGRPSLAAFAHWESCAKQGLPDSHPW